MSDGLRLVASNFGIPIVTSHLCESCDPPFDRGSEYTSWSSKPSCTRRESIGPADTI